MARSQVRAKFVILPVDQGFEHGPARWFAPNPPAYDPEYHFELAIESGCNAYAAPLGFLEAAAGAHIVKVKPPKDSIEQPEAKKAFEKYAIATKTLSDRVRHVIQSAFNGKRIVIFLVARRRIRTNCSKKCERSRPEAAPAASSGATPFSGPGRRRSRSSAA